MLNSAGLEGELVEALLSDWGSFALFRLSVYRFSSGLVIIGSYEVDDAGRMSLVLSTLAVKQETLSSLTCPGSRRVLGVGLLRFHEVGQRLGG